MRDMGYVNVLIKLKTKTHGNSKCLLLGRRESKITRNFLSLSLSRLHTHTHFTFNLFVPLYPQSLKHKLVNTTMGSNSNNPTPDQSLHLHSGGSGREAIRRASFDDRMVSATSTSFSSSSSSSAAVSTNLLSAASPRSGKSQTYLSPSNTASPGLTQAVSVNDTNRSVSLVGGSGGGVTETPRITLEGSLSPMVLSPDVNAVRRSTTNMRRNSTTGDAGGGAARKRTPKDFTFGRVIGEGSYSTVIYAKEVATDAEFAVKILDKRHIIKEKKVKYVQIEKEVLNKVSHPFIVRLFYTFQSTNSLYFVLEYASNGDLLTLLRKMSFDLSAVRFYMAEIVKGIEYLHSQQIIHRDLKPEVRIYFYTAHSLV
jgi:hypothetical protein